jgi:hypothetical protein
MAARLNHPNVVVIYDIIEEDGRPWIVMELVPHRSLRDVVQADGPLSPVQAAEVGMGILAALRAAHDAGVLHRDVKPGNVLFAPGGRVVLTDFGIARADGSPSLTASGVLVGSPSYIAPERARGGQAGAAADMWALGASLYAAVEGRPPFGREGVLPSLTAVVTDDPDPSSRAGPLQPVISGLLRKDPDARLGPAEVEQMLRRVVEEEGASPGARPIGSPADSAPGPAATARPGPAAAAVFAAVAGQEASNATATAALEQEAGAGAPPGAGYVPAPEPGSPDGPVRPPAQWAQPPGSARPGRRRFRLALAALAAAAVIAVIAAAIALVPASSARHQSGPHAASSHPAPAASATSSVPPSRAASSGPSSPSPAAPGSGGGTSTLPAGYYRFTNSTGFSIGVPAGWQVSHDGHYVYIQDPADKGIFLLIDQSDRPKTNPLADWEQQAANREGTYPGYHLILLQSVHYPQAEKAADWEFTYDRNGQAVEVLNRNVLANADHAYALYWSTPESDWNADYHFFRGFAGTFRPAAVDQGG